MDPLCYPKLVWWTYLLILFSTKCCENHRNKTYYETSVANNDEVPRTKSILFALSIYFSLSSFK